MLLQHVPAGKIKDLAEVFSGEGPKSAVLEEEMYNVNTKRVSSIAFKWK